MANGTLDLAGRVLRSRTVAALVTPHSIDHYLTQVHPLWVAHEVRARIVDRKVEVAPSLGSPDAAPVVTLTLQPTSTWKGHQPGQHVSVGVELPGARRTTRVFTISSHSSRPGERIQLTIRANDASKHERSVSQFLTSEAALGAIVHLSQAEGAFTLPARMPEHVVFITGGSGITPAMAMLRSLQMRTHRGRIDFLHFAHTPEHQIFADELEVASQSGNGLRVHRLYPGTGDPYLSPALLEKLVPGFAEIPTWACGPASLIEATKAAYGDSDTLQVEYFQPPRATGVAGGELTFARTGTTATNTGGSILEQAEAAGLRPNNGCRMGICFSCVATKRDGTVRNVLTGETSSLPDEDIRICVSAADGDCTIDL
ncbi:flavin reductase family protein [Nocardioides sp. Kera G14]|uniref:flavin reductase family protein n=1 Tax=Nocardioides sp. Kera G14 TaxID=2884264 RepID=UPI001D110AE2|nr:iron-sulfur cluster-binding domain-containing protein [Nocardioides sp. Kera G14]UDY23999.1 iron-sulfur cluster-binding domain-containing protein [Nocardioides sp. Kera G14]